MGGGLLTSCLRRLPSLLSLLPAAPADNATWDLAQIYEAAFQGHNDTTGCPKRDAYGEGYECEWWAPVSEEDTAALRSSCWLPQPAQSACGRCVHWPCC